MYSTGLFYETSPFGETLGGSLGDWFKKNWKWIVVIGSVLAYIFIPAVAGIIKAGALLIAGKVSGVIGKTKGITLDLLKSGAVNLYSKRDGSIGWNYQGKVGSVDLQVEEAKEDSEITQAGACYLATECYKDTGVPTAFYVVKSLLSQKAIDFYYAVSPFLVRHNTKIYTLPMLEATRVLFR